jgi:D-alanine-D-alanine ligase-like ATP-grasp enzyme
VKPARNTGKGNGVTAGITKRRDLARAMALAAVYGGEIIVEEQVAGDNYRLLFFDGELLDAVCRVPPTVRGDGIANLKELIRRENRERLTDGISASQTLLPIDWELRHVLRERGYGMDSVPPHGEVVRLKTVVSDNRRDENVDAMARLCPAIIEAAAAAAKAVGARLAAVDLITSDPQAPLTRSGGAIIEVNTTPGFYFHYMKRPAGAPVAKLILERLAGKAR